MAADLTTSKTGFSPNSCFVLYYEMFTSMYEFEVNSK